MNDRQPFSGLQISTLWDRHLPVLLAVCAGVGFSVAVFFVVRWWESRDIAAAFQSAAADRAFAVKNTFETEVGMLELFRAALMTDGKVEKDEFHEILMPFHSHDKSIEAVEWLPRVPDSQRQEFEAAARRNGFEGFQITEADKAGQMMPAGNRSEYFPIYFSGPRPADKGIVGYDVGSEAARLETLCQARDSGKAVASGRIDFVQDSEKAGGFLVCLPVYEKDKPIEDCCGSPQVPLSASFSASFGQATCSMRPSDNSSRKGSTWACTILRLPQASTTRTFTRRACATIAGNPSISAGSTTPKSMRYEYKLDVAGHPWTIACLPTPSFDADRRTLWPWGVMATGLAFTGMLAAYLWMSVDRKTYLEEKVREQTADIRRANEEVIDRLVSAAQWSDEETGMHIRRTGLLSEVLARAAGWFGDDVETIRQAAPMHDIGKIGIPDAILQKPGKLTPEEFAVMKTHTRIGADILSGSQSPMLQMARDIALNHHERWDGKGYPRGLAGKAIPESARIVAIVDVYDALTHDRVYRPAMPESEVLTIMQQGAGTQFDPLLMTFFFLHLSEIRRIAKEHPDDSRVGKHAFTWGGIHPAVSAAIPANEHRRQTSRRSNNRRLGWRGTDRHGEGLAERPRKTATIAQSWSAHGRSQAFVSAAGARHSDEEEMCLLSFADRLDAAVRRCRNPVLVGLDPRAESLPAGILPDCRKTQVGRKRPRPTGDSAAT